MNYHRRLRSPKGDFDYFAAKLGCVILLGLVVGAVGAMIVKGVPW